MTMKIFRKFLEKFDKCLLEGLTVIVLAILGFVYWWRKPYETVPLWAFIVVSFLAYIICLIVYAVYSVLIEREREEKETILKFPRVKYLQIRTDTRYGRKIIFLMEKHEFFAQGHYVTIAHCDDKNGIETMLGIGYIENITEQGDRQIILVRSFNDDHAMNIIAGLSNTRKCISAIRIMPSIPHSYIDLSYSTDRETEDWNNIE